MRVAHPIDGIVEEQRLDDIVEEEVVEEEFLVNANESVRPNGSAAETTNFPQLQVKKRLRAQFGRKRTHNEQVIVAPCGIILARETFYGAEAISSCVVCDFTLIHILFDTPTTFTGVYQKNIPDKWSTPQPHFFRQQLLIGQACKKRPRFQ